MPNIYARGTGRSRVPRESDGEGSRLASAWLHDALPSWMQDIEDVVPPAASSSVLPLDDGPAADERRPVPRLSSPPFKRASTGCIVLCHPVEMAKHVSRRGWQSTYRAEGSQRRLLALLPRGEDAVETVKTRNVVPPAPRRPTLPRGRRSSMPDLYARPQWENKLPFGTASSPRPADQLRVHPSEARQAGAR